MSLFLVRFWPFETFLFFGHTVYGQANMSFYAHNPQLYPQLSTLLWGHLSVKIKSSV